MRKERCLVCQNVHVSTHRLVTFASVTCSVSLLPMLSLDDLQCAPGRIAVSGAGAGGGARSKGRTYGDGDGDGARGKRGDGDGDGARDGYGDGDGDGDWSIPAEPQMRIVRQKPRDARTVSDLNWEGQKSLETARKDPTKPPPKRVVRDPTDETQGGARLSTIGPFYSYCLIPENQQVMLRSLRSYFEHPDGTPNEAILQALADMIDEKHCSLKLFDWFVSQYTKEHRMCRQVVAPDGAGTAVVDIHNAYKSDRWAVRKRHWDFACKRIKVAFRLNGRVYVTAVTQLNAFVFVHKFGIKALLLDNKAAVEAHYEKGRKESEQAAVQAARALASAKGLPEGAPLKRKRGRRKKIKTAAAPPPDPILLSECSVKTRLSLQDD